MVIIIGLYSCDNISSSKRKLENIDIEAVLNSKDELLPNMCELVTLGDVASIFHLNESDIIKRNSSPTGSNPKQKTCFFKWEDPNFPNSAIMVQAIRNPLGDEYPNYIIEIINTKREKGERSVTDKETHLFVDMDSMADEAIYNSEVGKYFWRLSDKVLFQLAFNTSHTPSEQLKLATQLGDKMIEKYLDI